MDKMKLAVDFHKAIDRTCRAGSDDYGYLTGWGGMPEYDKYVMSCLDGAAKYSEDNNYIPWSFGREDELFFYKFGDCEFFSKEATMAIMLCVLKYRATQQEPPELFPGTNDQLNKLSVGE
jgi:hypothetical protein